MDFLIEEVKCDIGEGGMACGPIDGPVVAVVKYNDGTGSKYLTNIEFQGWPSFFITENDIFEDALADDPDNEEFIDFINSEMLDDFNGLELGSEYEEITEHMKECEDPNVVKFIKYIIAVTRCGFEELDNLIEIGTGKKISEIEIPRCEFEEDEDDFED